MEDRRNPYYQHFYKVSLDGGEPVLLTPEDADHKVKLSPGGTWFVDTYYTTATAPVTQLRNAVDGTLVREVARGDIRSEEHTSELQSIMRISYAVLCFKKKNPKNADSYS